MSAPVTWQKVTDWRCSVIGWQRGRLRPVMTIRLGRAAKPGLGWFVDRDEDDEWTMVFALFRLVDIQITMAVWAA